MFALRMRTFKPSDEELPNLQAIATVLKVCNGQMAAAKKRVEGAKEQLTKWLKENRQVDIHQLEIGELVNLEGVVLIEVGKMAKFDEKGFALAEAAKHAEWVKDLRMERFKPLV